MEAPIKILRDCDSTLIPSGDQIKLIKGTLVRVTQALEEITHYMLMEIL